MSLSEMRAEKDHYFRDDDSSPLTPEQRLDFEGLPYYPEDPTFDVTATLEPFEQAQKLTMITSRGTRQDFYRLGRLHFKIQGTPQELTLFQDAGQQYLFLPFTDATSGDTTYDAGRYVEVEAAGRDGEALLVRIDFNQAYNPYCAYNESWVCPIPPAENRLTVPILAGEKKFHDLF